MMKKFLLLLSVFLGVTSLAYGQILTPVKWSNKVEMGDGQTGTLVMSATMDAGWHVYGPDIAVGGPTPLEITYNKLEGVELVGKPEYSRPPTVHYDPNFEEEVPYWDNNITVRQRFKVTAPEYTIAGRIRYGTCDDSQCLPPGREDFSFSGTAKVAAAKVEEKKEEEKKEEEPAVAEEAVAAVDSVAVADTTTVAAIDSLAGGAELASTWTPVTFDEESNDNTISSTSLWVIFLMCFIGGFVALLTPCVWPMIPLTVSFFLKRGKSRSRAVVDAATYGFSIIVIYVLLGLVITLIFGADALNKLATSAVCNLIFFALLVVFAFSFFGAFEIKLPEKWGNKMDASAEKTTGLLSIFFMAFTLALVSFSCTGPIIGTLLVEAASTGNAMGPAVGMLGFSLALAIPFFLFALFPSWLNSAPRSGSWMNTVKVVLGFVELILSLKFLSVADLAYGWHILDREIFLALWIAMFGLMGLYLLGKFEFSHYGEPTGSVGVFRFSLALISFAVTIYLLPGLWGAPLKGTSAFVPPLFTQDFNLYGNSMADHYDDYDAAMAASAREGKPVFVDFSGYGCVNCRKMEAAVLDDPNVHAMLEENFILVTLMTDDRKPLPEPVTVVENGKELVLETVGEKWSYLERVKFGANAQPYYVVLDSKGKLLSGPFAHDENIPRFTRFLEKGLSGYKR